MKHQNEEGFELGDDLEDALCSRCECCDTVWEDCYDCGGKGGRTYEDDLQFEDPLWYQPGDFETCDTCEGEGGWSICLGKCDKNGKHEHAGLGKFLTELKPEAE